MQLSRVVTISLCDIPEYIAAATIPAFRRRFTWSFISAMSGVTTMHVPSFASAGTWKVIDLPPPVGIRPRVSLPLPMLSMMSSCIPRKSSYPQYSLRICLYIFLKAYILNLKLHVASLVDVFLDGIGYAEASSGFYVSCHGTLAKGDSVDDIA